jgi:hypothetical protein
MYFFSWIKKSSSRSGCISRCGINKITNPLMVMHPDAPYTLFF